MNMDGDIKALDTPYWEFFTKASRAHLIPTLQRPYTWSKLQVTRLWDDIIENDIAYYIGSIVVIGSSGTTQRDEVIDGQQRLTTISLILIALQEYIGTRKVFEDVRKEIQWLLSEPMHEAPAQPRLRFSNENANEFYEALMAKTSITTKTRSQNVFETNLKIIKAELARYSPNCKPSEIRTLFEKIKNLQIVFIRCTNRSAAYQLFESLNARSVSLASNDLIKNRIFQILHQEGGEQLKIGERKWQEIESIFDEDTTVLKTFIRHHWISLGRYTSHAKLFNDFEDYLDEEGSATEYLDMLVEASKIYVALRKANVDSLTKLPSIRFEREEVRKSLEFLNYLGVDQIYSVLLYLYQKDPKNFKKDLNRLVAFQFLYKYVPGSPSEPEKKYFAALPAADITKQKMFDGLHSLVRGQGDVFSEKLIARSKYREGKSGDIQFALEKYLGSFGDARAFKQPTIEHILSQSQKQAPGVVHSFGNLTILEKVENGGDYGSKPFAEKAALYEQDLFLGNRKICEYPFLTDPEVAVKQRGKDMADTIYKVFLTAVEKGKWVELEEESPSA